MTKKDSLILTRLQKKELDFLSTKYIFNSINLSPHKNFLPMAVEIELEILGSNIQQARIKRGFSSFALEDETVKNNFALAPQALQRLNHKTPIFYQLALESAREILFGIRPSDDQCINRAIMLECARVCHHLHVIKNLARALEAHRLFRECRYLNQIIEIFFRPLLAMQENSVQIELNSCDSLFDEALKNFTYIESLFMNSQNIRKRLQYLALIDLRAAMSSGLDGLFLRANRVHQKNIFQNPNIKYPTSPKLILKERGDLLSRLVLRLGDIRNGILWLKQHLVHRAGLGHEIYPEIFPARNKYPEIPTQNYGVGTTYGPEGLIKAMLFFDNHANSFIFRLRCPAFYIAQAIPTLLSNTNIHDTLLILYSLGITTEEIDT